MAPFLSERIGSVGDVSRRIEYSPSAYRVLVCTKCFSQCYSVLVSGTGRFESFSCSQKPFIKEISSSSTWHWSEAAGACNSASPMTPERIQRTQGHLLCDGKARSALTKSILDNSREDISAEQESSGFDQIRRREVRISESKLILNARHIMIYQK